MHPRRSVAFALALWCGLAGCAGGTPSPSPSVPSSPAAVSQPSGGVSLRQLGFSNGPVDTVFLPTSVTVTRRVDQVNVTSAFGPAADGPSVVAFLRRTLPAAGWTVDTDAGGSLLFHDAGHDGAFTQSADLWALTLRRTQR